MTTSEYEKLADSQKYRCKICKTKDPKAANRKLLYVDHCHETGVVRGLLCFQCNVGLGNFEDSIDLLTHAIKYLEDSGV